MSSKFRSGFVAIMGRPNVGKSSLMNRFVGEKVAIVSNHPQTTRSKLLGVATGEDWQIVFVDTPGLHTPRTKLGRAHRRRFRRPSGPRGRASRRCRLPPRRTGLPRAVPLP